MSMERAKSLEPCPVGAEELAEINRFTRTPLTAEEVYCFAVRLCDNEVDRDFERFDTETLSALGDLFVGKSGIFDHRWSAEGQTARIYRDRGRHQEGGQRGLQREAQRLLHLRGGGRQL